MALNPLSAPAATILGYGPDLSDQLRKELAERQKKAMNAARLSGTPGQLLAAPSPPVR